MFFLFVQCASLVQSPLPSAIRSKSPSPLLFQTPLPALYRLLYPLPYPTSLFVIPPNTELSPFPASQCPEISFPRQFRRRKIWIEKTSCARRAGRTLVTLLRIIILIIPWSVIPWFYSKYVGNRFIRNVFITIREYCFNKVPFWLSNVFFFKLRIEQN